MTPRVAGGWALRGVVLTGLLGLGLGAPSSRGVAACALLGVVLPAPRLPARIWPWLHGAVLLLTGVMGVLGSSLPAFALLTGWLLVFQVWSGKSAEHARTSLLLSTLLLLLGSVQSESALLAPVFVVYAALLPVALLRAQLLDVEASPPRALEAGTALGCGVFAALLFTVLPRLDGGYIGGGHGRASFPETVALGDNDDVVSDDVALVMRLKVTGPDGRQVGGPFHVRGRVLDHFDGRRWTATLPSDGRDEDVGWNRKTEVWLEPMASDVLFGVGVPDHVEGITGVRHDGNRGFYHRQPGHPLHYYLYGLVADARGEQDEDETPWLQLPDVDPGVRALAWSVVPQESDPFVVATALRAKLATEWPYDPTPSPPHGDPLTEFLLEKKPGHCEYFATALAVMLRVRQIPARLATGFYTGELDSDGLVVARRGHGHAWVEVRTGRGWAVVDPTPDSDLPQPETGTLAARLEAFAGAWYSDVVEYDAQAQFTAWGALGRPFVGLPGGEASGQPNLHAGLVGMAIGAGALVGLVLGVRAILALVAGGGGKKTPDPLAKQMQAARVVVRRRGWSIPDDLPPVEAASWLEARVGAKAAPLRDLAWIVYRSRYGGEVRDDALAEAKACVRALRTLPRPAAGGRG